MADPLAEIEDLVPSQSTQPSPEIEVADAQGSQAGSSITDAAESGEADGQDDSTSTQTAALPPVDEPGPQQETESEVVRLLFEPGSAEVSTAAAEKLEQMVQAMHSNLGLRLQVIAFASDDEASRGNARTLSISRGLAVRSFLTERGIRAVRLDVRAQGNRYESGPASRVDIAPAKR